MAAFGLPYSGTEVWEIEDDFQANGFQTFLKDFANQNTRTEVLSQSDYVDGNNDGVNVVAFMSRESAKALMSDVAGTTPRTGVVGVSLHLGYDKDNEAIVLIARSSDGYLSRPTGSTFTDFNYLSKVPTDTNANSGLSDADAADLMANFRTEGYTFLTGLADDSALSVKFDNQVLFHLLYADNGPTSASGQTEIHLIVAPPWEGETGRYLTGGAKGKKANNNPVHHGLPPCPPY